MLELSNVLENYLHTKAKLGGRAVIINSVDQISILRDLPKFFLDVLDEHNLSHLFKVEGSIGKGNMPRVPWVGIFDRSVTETAEDGYYIVLLFAEDMSACFLSLLQGVTAMEKRYTRKLALTKMSEIPHKLVTQLPFHPEATIGRIQLNATGDLSRGYEYGAIESFRYSAGDLPTASVLRTHFNHLLSNYRRLVQIAGKSLESLVHVNEEEFQLAVLEKAAAASDKLTLDDSPGGEPLPSIWLLGSKTFARSPSVAARAIRNANFQCEIDPKHWSFKSRAKKQQYVEAHHLVPMGKQGTFEYSLDVVANVVALCATCHRLLHHGLPREKKILLRKLFSTRRHRLAAKAIYVGEREIFSYYGGAFVEEV